MIMTARVAEATLDGIGCGTANMPAQYRLFGFLLIPLGGARAHQQRVAPNLVV